MFMYKKFKEIQHSWGAKFSLWGVLVVHHSTLHSLQVLQDRVSHVGTIYRWIWVAEVFLPFNTVLCTAEPQLQQHHWRLGGQTFEARHMFPLGITVRNVMSYNMMYWTALYRITTVVLMLPSNYGTTCCVLLWCAKNSWRLMARFESCGTSNEFSRCFNTSVANRTPVSKLSAFRVLFRTSLWGKVQF